MSCSYLEFCSKSRQSKHEPFWFLVIGVETLLDVKIQAAWGMGVAEEIV